MTATHTANTPAALLADLENLWGCLDALLARLAPDEWRGQHGRHWTFADVPYHLGYFDRELVAAPIEHGLDVPAAEQWAARSFEALDAWNARMFAHRPFGQSVAQSLAEMRASRDTLRAVVGRMRDADFNRPAWFPLLVGGWVPAHAVLALCRLHTWRQVMELRLRHPGASGGPLPQPRPATTHAALGDRIGLFPLLLNRAPATQTRLTLAMVFRGPGGGAWTVRVADGACEVSEGREARADLVLTLSPECFVKLCLGLHGPQAAIRSGELVARGIAHLDTFAALFVPQYERRLGDWGELECGKSRKG